MRSFLIAACVLALHVLGLGVTRDHLLRRRKTLGFGLAHPHAVFHAPIHGSSNDDGGFAPLEYPADSDPFEVAERFLVDTLVASGGGQQGWAVRRDSYTDENTGVTHVYVRQLVNGIEVADGDINLNVKDGEVISFGNSFYNGPIPEFHGAGGLGADRCRGSLDREQVVMGLSLDQSCAHPHALEVAHESIGDPRVPLLHFMAVATPDDRLVGDIAARFQEHVDNISSPFEAAAVGSHRIAVEFFLHNVPDTVNPVKAKIAYAQVPDGGSTALRLVWKFEVEMEHNWYETAVSAFPPYDIVSVVDWASDSMLPLPEIPREPATYNVFAWGVNDPTEGNRSIVKENYDVLASPLGWHSLPFDNDPDPDVRELTNGEVYRNTTTTWGNNVFAHENWDRSVDWKYRYRPDGGKRMAFDFKYDPKSTNEDDALDEAKKHINATVTQLFYTSNMFHDLMYRYGFDEVSGNFQQYNFGRGGEENDAIIANAQDGKGYNDATFVTPPDGQHGRCSMYLWDTALPYRDGDFEAGVIIHELTHGLSMRLTGGPANSGCLGWGESGGMGEGWGDFYASVIRSKRNYSDYPVGAWVSNNAGGVRLFPYSLDEAVNPSTYQTLDKPEYWSIHNIGGVWAEILWVVNHRLVAKHGFADDLFPPAPLPNGTIPEGDFYRPAEYTAAGKRKPLVPKHGNSLSIQLVMNGMKLQPCRPTFFNARDSIIQADQVLTGGENYCELWEAFAQRGLGPDASAILRTPWGRGVRTNDFQVPPICSKEPLSERG